MRLTIGLDFGTAFTKVVVADSASRRYVVTFEDALRATDAEACFLPGFLAVERSGLGWLGFDPSDSNVLADLKYQLLEDTLDANSRAAIVCYLALVFRYTRHWLMTRQRSVYTGRRLDWYVNVGVPTAQWRQGRIDDEYRRLVEAAWALSIANEEATLGTADTMLRTAPRLLGDRLANVPEFIAQIAMYVNSPQRQMGLHLLIDVGAGTLDVSTFNVHDGDGEHVFPIFASRVEHLGCHYAIRRALAGSIVREIEDTGFDTVRIAAAAKLAPAELQQRLNTVGAEVREAIAGVLADTKTRRYRGSPAWSEGLPVLLCGGGREVGLYQAALKSIAKSGYTIRQLCLNRPARLHAPALSEADFQRLSVAYGLSYPLLNLGKVRAINEVPDDVAPSSTTDYRDHYPGKEQC